MNHSDMRLQSDYDKVNNKAEIYSQIIHVRYEVFTAVTMKNSVCCDVTQFGSRNNGR
jgi:hypothetical protein